MTNARLEAAMATPWHRLQFYSSLVNELLDYYGLEGIAMPYTMDDFEREVEQKILKKLTPEQRLEGLSAEDMAAQGDNWGLGVGLGHTPISFGRARPMPLKVSSHTWRALGQITPCGPRRGRVVGCRDASS